MSQQTNPSTCRVVFQPSGRQGEVPAGTNLLDAARMLGVEIEAICSGKQTCGKCQIAVEDGVFAKHGITSAADHLTPPDSRETHYWEKHPRTDGRRMACGCEVLSDLVVFVPEESQARKQIVRKAATERAIVIDPAIRLYYVEVVPPTLEHQLGDWDRIAAEIDARFGLKDVRLDPVLLGSLQKIVRQGKWGVTVTVWQDREAVRVQPGYVEEAFGLAVDIGSTTVAMHLCDLRTGAIVATASRMNPQVAYGEDLMSRVSYCDDRPDGLATLHGAIIAALNELAAQAAAEAGVTTDAITDIVLVGNTVMHHILLNVPPRELGTVPLRPCDQRCRGHQGARSRPEAGAGRTGARAAGGGGPRRLGQCGRHPGRGAGQGAIRRSVADRRCGHQRRVVVGQPGSAFLGLQPNRPRV